MPGDSYTPTGDLIRRNPGGAEVPAPGWWSIANRHVSVCLSARTGLLRRVHAAASWACGGLHVADDLILALELHVGTSTSTVPSLARLLTDDLRSEMIIRTTAIEPGPNGVWYANGSVQAGRSVPALATISYRGVYRAASAANAWVTVDAKIAHDAAGQPLRYPIRLIADALAVKTPPPPRR